MAVPTAIPAAVAPFSVAETAAGRPPRASARTQFRRSLSRERERDAPPLVLATSTRSSRAR